MSKKYKKQAHTALLRNGIHRTPVKINAAHTTIIAAMIMKKGRSLTASHINMLKDATPISPAIELLLKTDRGRCGKKRLLVEFTCISCSFLGRDTSFLRQYSSP